MVHIVLILTRPLSLPGEVVEAIEQLLTNVEQRVSDTVRVRVCV